MNVKILSYKDKEEILLILIFIDILFLPSLSLPLLPTMPISLPFVVGYCFLHPHIVRRNKVFIPFVGFVLLLLLSIIFGIVFSPEKTILNGELISVSEYNLKRTFQIIILFSYLFFITSININREVIQKLLSVFVLWYLFLGLLSALDLNTYFNIHEMFYGNNTISNTDYYLNYESYNIFRYRYFFLDANTSIYFFLLITFFLLVNFRGTMKYNIFLHTSNIIAVLLSQSTGAFVTTILFYTFYFFINPLILRGAIFNKRNAIKVILLLIIVAIASLLSIMIYFYSNNLDLTEVGFLTSGFDRITNNDGGGRFDKYILMFNDRLPLLWGEGYVLVRNNLWFRPHSDILRMLYSYGLIAFVLFMYIFRKSFSYKSFLIFLPTFTAFAVNSLLDDQKFFTLFLLLYGMEYEGIRKQLNKNHITLQNVR